MLVRLRLHAALQDVPVTGSSATAGLSGGHMGGRAQRALVPVAPGRPYGVDAAFLSHEDHKTLRAGPHCCQAQLFSQGTAGATCPSQLHQRRQRKRRHVGNAGSALGMLGLQGMPGARGVRCMLGVAPVHAGSGASGGEEVAEGQRTSGRRSHRREAGPEAAA